MRLSIFFKVSAAKSFYFVIDFYETFWPVNGKNYLLERNLKLYKQMKKQAWVAFYKSL